MSSDNAMKDVSEIWSNATTDGQTDTVTDHLTQQTPIHEQMTTVRYTVVLNLATHCTADQHRIILLERRLPTER